MQVKKIATLVAIACAGFAGSASAALSPAQQNVLDTANSGADVSPNPPTIPRIFFLSGASATQGGLTQIQTTLFNAGSFRLADKSTGTKNFEAIAGTFSAAAGAWAGKTGIFIYRVKGGSVFGVNPVASPAGSGSAIETLIVKSAKCGATGTGSASTPFVCDTSLLPTALPAEDRIPDAGVSDVAPKFFRLPYNTEGESSEPQLTDTQLAEFSNVAFNKPIFSLAFGPAVTNNVDVPLNKAAVAAIMTGNVTSWNQVDKSLPADDIVICRRVQGSGTQSVFNNYFGGFPCDANFNVPAARDSGSGWDGTNYNVTGTEGDLVVIENSSSGEVRNCLTTAANPAGGSYGTFDRSGNPVTVTFAPKTGGHKAIGVLSLDSIGSSDAAVGKWSFRAFNGDGKITCTGTCPASATPVVTGTVDKMGVVPLLDNLVDGSWDMQGWVSFNVPHRTTLIPGKAGIASAFLAKAQDPAVLAINNNFKYTAAALPTNVSGFSGAQVLRSGYLNNDQCGPLNRNFNGNVIVP